MADLSLFMMQISSRVFKKKIFVASTSPQIKFLSLEYDGFNSKEVQSWWDALVKRMGMNYSVEILIALFFHSEVSDFSIFDEA
jgi:hypothetical protein